MSSPGFRIIEYASCRREADCDFIGIEEHRCPEPLLASMETAVDAPLCPQELPFLEEERRDVTILFGGLTWKHERLIEGLLAGSGYRCQALAETDRAAHELGKEFCASGLCNPVYFTAGNLIRFLRQLEAGGLSPAEIVKRYVYFTAACGGPCRFGMYENEFRMALRAAGYNGFRVLSFSQDHGLKASTGHTGLHFSVDFGMNALHAFILGDLLNAVHHRLKPYEMQAGATMRAVARAADRIAEHFQTGRSFELEDPVPSFLLPQRESKWYRVPNTLGKVWSHLYGNAVAEIVPSAAKELERVEVDWLQVKPVVKVIGEFWAQMTESDGNFRMLEFLESEGAEVSIEPISTWVLYLLQQRKEKALLRVKINNRSAGWTNPGKAMLARMSCVGRRMGFTLGSKIYLHHFRRLASLLGVPDLRPASQAELSELARPHYNTFLRGGEGHLEVAKTLYYTRRKSCHLVLALKPFGCLPSVQSDGVQASLVERYPEVSFLPIETSGDREIHAYSRAQMALSEAKSKAIAEFERVVQSLRHPLDEVRSFVAEHPELRHPLHPIPRHSGVTSTAANFLLYADRIMSWSLPDRVTSYGYGEHRRGSARLKFVPQEIEDHE
jgi:predicted nucleotide-binding protein (sugar kinase/HSP70/actin superfamily)